MSSAYTLEQISEAVRASLSDDLRKTKYRGSAPFVGHCYVASEAFYHLVRLVGPRSFIIDFRFMKWEGDSHWYCVVVEKETWEQSVWDLTQEQFKVTPDYRRGRVVSFLTTFPSKRAQTVIVRAMTILENSADKTIDNL
jgi:hypothetical protein